MIATPFYERETFPKNRLDELPKPIVGILYERNAPDYLINDKRPVVLERATSHYLQEAAQYLERTADKDLEEDRTLEGLIISLSSEKSNEKIITISTEEWGKVSFSVKSDEYTAACNAHREGHVISIKGKARQTGEKETLDID